jgi:hypothetical protein
MQHPSAIPSPIDVVPTPDQLTARVVRPGSQPLLHGYGVARDLARHYGMAELSLLTLTGELPEPRAARAFAVAMAFAAPIGIDEAPSHAAVLSRLCGTPSSRVIAVAAIALSEQARTLVEAQAPLLDWLVDRLAEPAVTPPATAISHEPEDLAQIEALREALAARDACAVPALAHPLAPWPAIFAVLHAAGLTQPWQIEAALCLARLGVAAAEAMAAEGGMRAYPMNVPPFAYLHERSTDG